MTDLLGTKPLHDVWNATSHLLLITLVATIAPTKLVAQHRPPLGSPQPHEPWTDPTTGLTWAGQDNGKDVSLPRAITYCRSLRLSGFADWRLANMFELQHLYDKAIDSPGLAGKGDKEAVMWHVRGSIFLTGYEWSNRVDGKRKSGGYAYYFDFNEGKSNNQPTGFLYSDSFMRALCVRGSGDPLGRH